MDATTTLVRRTKARRSLGRKPLAIAIGFAFGTAVIPAVHAATLLVTTTSDAGAGSLRDTVTIAAPGDTINFSVTGTITLTTGEIAFAKNLIIGGPGAASLTLTKSGAAARIFNITGTPTVTISGLTFSGAGGVAIKGGAIAKVGGSLTVQNSVLTNNVGYGGGALYNQTGPLNIQSSVFTGNTVGAVNDGLRDGGALYIRTGNVTIQNSTISGNRCGNDGGGIYHSTGVLTISNSTMANNQAQYGSAISRFCGLCNLGYSNNSTTITNSTITGNSTFAGAVSVNYGGALWFNNATHTISNSTIAGNASSGGQGGGIHLYGGTVNLVSTIVSGSTDNPGNVGGGTRDLFGRTSGTVATFNVTNSLVQNAGGFVNGTNINNVFGQNPVLGPLANNGGPTQTMALLAGSPAINTGANPGALAFDQRGTPFVRSNGLTDIGAFELQGAPPPPVAVVPVPTLSQWGVALLSVLMAGWAMITGFGRRRRR